MVKYLILFLAISNVYSSEFRDTTGKLIGTSKTTNGFTTFRDRNGKKTQVIDKYGTVRNANGKKIGTIKRD